MLLRILCWAWRARSSGRKGAGGGGRWGWSRRTGAATAATEDQTDDTNKAKSQGGSSQISPLPCPAKRKQSGEAAEEANGPRWIRPEREEESAAVLPRDGISHQSGTRRGG